MPLPRFHGTSLCARITSLFSDITSLFCWNCFASLRLTRVPCRVALPTSVSMYDYRNLDGIDAPFPRVASPDFCGPSPLHLYSQAHSRRTTLHVALMKSPSGVRLRGPLTAVFLVTIS